MKQLREYVERYGIGVVVKSGPNWSRDDTLGDGRPWEHHAYELELINDALGTRMTLPWKQGVGITEDPDERPEVILNCLISDAWNYMNVRSFEEWADELGYDTDSRSAEALYRRCGEAAEEFIGFLGGESALNLLALKYERL